MWGQEQPNANEGLRKPCLPSPGRRRSTPPCLSFRWQLLPVLVPVLQGKPMGALLLLLLLQWHERAAAVSTVSWWRGRRKARNAVLVPLLFLHLGRRPQMPHPSYGTAFITLNSCSVSLFYLSLMDSSEQPAMFVCVALAIYIKSIQHVFIER